MAEPQDKLADGSSLQDLTGSRVGRFAIRSRLGSGGMGEVYRADDTTLKRPVALKRLAPHLRADLRFRQRFLKEAERASALSHQHIAGIYDVLEEKGEPFLVMEYVEGTTLRTRLREPLPQEGFLKIALQCAEALVAAHEKRIVHCDIKPENIMLTSGGHVKILDFGVAKRIPHSDEKASTDSYEPRAGGLSGTPAYMAPEVLVDKEADGRADIFSLGVVFYEALTRRHPFVGPTFVATTDRILHEDPPPLRQLNPGVSAELERIVGKMLAKDPAGRYSTAAELLADLRAVEKGLALPGLRSMVRHPARWRVALLASFGVVALLFVAATLWRAFRPTPPTERVSVAILPFANRTGDPRLDQFRMTLTQMLVLDLTGSPNIRVLPYERLLEITRGLESKSQDLSSPEAVKTVAGYSNAQFVVVPAMFAAGNAFRVSAEFRDAQTGETIGATKAERTLSGSPEETFYRMLQDTADGIQAYFKRARRGGDYRPRPEGSRPRTVAAAFHYTQGKDALAQGMYARALASFQLAAQEDSGFALAYARTGQIYGLLGYDDKARESSEKAAQLIRSDTPVIDAYFIQANLAERRYDYAAAEDKYRELIRLYPDDPASYADVAAVYEQQGQYRKAIAGYQDAVLRDPRYVVAYQQLSRLYPKIGDFSLALSNGQKALEFYRSLGNREGEAGALVDLGGTLRLKGEYLQAGEYANSALRLFQDLKNEFGVLRASKLLGDILASRGDLARARDTYQQILSTSGEIRNNRLVVQTLMNIGVTYQMEGDLAKAVEYYQRSIAPEWPALRERAQATTNLGSVLIEYGPDPERGVEHVRNALPIFQRMGDKHWEAQDRMLLGLYYTNAGQYGRAVAELQQSARLCQTVEYKVGATQATYDLGRCYFFQNRYEQALDSVENALALAQGIQDPFRVAMSQILLGWVHGRLGDGQARSLLDEGLKAAQTKGYGELLPDAYNALGEIYRDGGEKDQARHSFRQAFELAKGSNVSESSIEARANLGLLEAEEGHFLLALSYCGAAVGQARKLQHLHTLARALIGLAGVDLLQMKYAEAIQALDELSPAAGRDDLGLELRAQIYSLKGEAFEGQGISQEADAAFRQAQEAIRQLQQSLGTGHREGFAARRSIESLLRKNRASR